MDVDAIAVSGAWIRHAPHRSSLLGRAGERIDGRWQHADVAGGLYLADEPATATAEWYRWLAERGLPPSRATPHDHHIWNIDVAIADLSDHARLAAVGLAPPQPSLRMWPAYQTVGDALYQDGWAGLLVPSAARPQSLIVCIFNDVDWPPPGCTPSHAVEIADVPPPPTGMTT